MFEKVRDARIERLGPDHPATLGTLSSLATSYTAAGRASEAIELLENVHNVVIAKLGSEHPSTLGTLFSLAEAHKKAGRTGEAIAVYDQVGKSFAPEHPSTTVILNAMGETYLNAGKHAEAIAVLEKARELHVLHRGPNHPQTITTLYNLGITYVIAGKMAEAVPHLEQATSARTAQLGAKNPSTLMARVHLAKAYSDSNRTAEAIETLEELRDDLPADHASTSFVLSSLARLYQDGGRSADAIVLLEKARYFELAKHGPDHRNTATSARNLAHAYRSAGQPEEAAKVMRELNELRRKELAGAPPDDWKSLLARGELYAQIGEWQKAASDFNAVIAAQPDDHWNRGGGRISAGDVLRPIAQGGWEDGLSNDGDPYVDDIIGWDFVANTNKPRSIHPHGTEVAGIIGATGNNGVGITGINWRVQMMLLRAGNDIGRFNTGPVLEALDYTVAHGARVANGSFDVGSLVNQAGLEAVKRAHAAGIILVVGAGNDEHDLDSFPDPLGFRNLDNVVVVAATDDGGALADFSSYGATTVNLAAPGDDVLTTSLDPSKYGPAFGTSFATPHVTGVLALLCGLHPEWTYRQAIDQVLTTVDPVAELAGKVVTGGRLNAARALGSTQPRSGVVEVVATEDADQITLRAVAGDSTTVELLVNGQVQFAGPKERGPHIIRGLGKARHADGGLYQRRSHQ